MSQLVLACMDVHLLGGENRPGRKSSTVRPPAHGAMAVHTRLSWHLDLVLHGLAKTCTLHRRISGPL